jgi:hypothetical protein
MTHTVFQFQRQKRNIEHAHTAILLSKLMSWTMETGLATTTVAITELVLWFAKPEVNYYFIT